jgi:eukaryotic-like serine/threonine-protein kinase
MTQITLKRGSWFYDEIAPLGPEGGFGVVFAGKTPDGQPVAIKRLKLDAEASAHRELRIASELSGKTTEHVIPIFDAGEDSGRYFVVMATAQKSLQTDLDSGRTFSEEEVSDILLQTSQGIAELNGLVHRDLKPGNLLFHENVWEIADFGIARFVEEATSSETLKTFLSPQYAAPEQWNFRRAEVATDLYALGCIGYRLLAGHLPYPGPSMEELRQQHLQEVPAALPSTFSPNLRTLVQLLLRKTLQERPSLQRVTKILTDIKSSAGQHRASSIAEVASRLEQKRAGHEALAAAQAERENDRDELALAGRATLGAIIANLRKRILDEAPTTMQDSSSNVSLGQAQMSLPLTKTFPSMMTLAPGSFPHSGIDVLLARTFELQQLNPRYVWSSSLLFCRLPQGHDFRWYEVAFMVTPISNRMSQYAPFSLLEEANDAKYRYQHADFALSNTIHVYQTAFGLTPIDHEDEESFIDRWITLFGVAAEGRLKYPSRLPLASDFWEKLHVYGI